MLPAGEPPAQRQYGVSPLAVRIPGPEDNTPTSEDTMMATIADSPDTGTLYSVRKRTENGRASPMRIPMTPPIREINMASDRNW